MTRQAKPLFPVKCEDRLERSVDEWSGELGIVLVTSSHVTSSQWGWCSYSFYNKRSLPQNRRC
jgi:hypothetical protein